MSNKKLPPEGMGWEEDDWTPDDSDSGSQLNTYVERLADAERINEERAAIIKELEAKIADFERQKGEFDTIRAGRDAGLLSLQREKKELEKALNEERRTRAETDDQLTHKTQLTDVQRKDIAQADRERKRLEQKLESDVLKTKKEILNHRLIIGGVGALALLLGILWAVAKTDNGELQDTNDELSASNAAYAADRRTTVDLRNEITTLTNERNQARARANTLQSSLSQAQTREAQAVRQREEANARGNMPGGVAAYPRVRVAFLTYINGLGSRFAVNSEYVSCVRGEVLDDLESAYSNRYGERDAWTRFKQGTKREFERCRRRIQPYSSQASIHGNIMDDYMYKQGNFLERVQRDFGS